MKTFNWSKCTTFVTGVNKARRLSHLLLLVTVTTNGNKEEGNVAFVRKGEEKHQRGRQEGEEKTITGSEGVRHNETDEQIFLACDVWWTSRMAAWIIQCGWQSGGLGDDVSRWHETHVTGCSGCQWDWLLHVCVLCVWETIRETHEADESMREEGIVCLWDPGPHCRGTHMQSFQHPLAYLPQTLMSDYGQSLQWFSRHIFPSTSYGIKTFCLML